MNHSQNAFERTYAQIENTPLNRREMLLMGRNAFAASILATMAGKGSAEEDTHAHEKMIDTLWNAQNEKYQKIADMGMQRFFDELPDKEKAFLTQQEIREGNGVCSCCSDEGIRHYTSRDTAKDMLLIRTPGSGILLAVGRPDKDPFAPEFIESTAKEQLELGVTVFTSHLGCGAAKAVFNARVTFLKEQGKIQQANALEEKGSDAWARDWTDAVAKRMREMASELNVEHMGKISTDFIDKLDRPMSTHIARDLYLTDRDEFNASYNGLPQGYVERTGNTNLDTTLKHADVLRGISFDKAHGFGTKFSKLPAEQFIICAIAENRQRMNVLKAHAEKKRMSFPRDEQEKVRIEGIVA